MLQELCLSPDMWICIEDWTYLSTEGYVPTTMSDYVALSYLPIMSLILLQLCAASSARDRVTESKGPR
jgi:hypothetical protein